MHSHRAKLAAYRVVRLLNFYEIAGTHDSACDHHRHDRALHSRIASSLESHSAPQATLDALNLDARLAKARDLYDGVLSQAKPHPGAKFDQAEMPCRDVLAKSARFDVKANRLELVDQFRFDEMNLSKVFPRGIAGFVVEVLHGRAAVRIALNAKPSGEGNGIHRQLPKDVLSRSGDSGHEGSF
jgi:hypothetical protein